MKKLLLLVFGIAIFGSFAFSTTYMSVKKLDGSEMLFDVDQVKEVNFVEKDSVADSETVIDASTSGFNYIITSDNEVSISGITIGKKNMVIPSYVKIDGTVYKVTNIEEGVIDGLDYLESLTLPGTIDTIKSGLIGSCDNLKTITLTEGVKVIAEDAFFYSYDKKSPVTSIILPNSLDRISENAFGNCPELKSIYIGNGLKHINGYSFNGCDSLTDIEINTDNPNLVYENGVIYSKDKSELIYCGIEKKGSFTIPSSVRYVHNGAFCCSSDSLKVIAPLTVTSFDFNSFNGKCNVAFEGLDTTVTKENHAYVDLGLSVNWAMFNVGAVSLFESGDYFRWGETEKIQLDSTLKNYLYCEETILKAENDAATANWGTSWRMPTKEEVQELVDNCLATYNGGTLYLKSKVNGRFVSFNYSTTPSISRFENPLSSEWIETWCLYCSFDWQFNFWTSTSSPDENGGFRFLLYYASDFCYEISGLEGRSHGLHVRAVTSK